MAKNKNKHVVIAYYPGADKADMAADQLKAWDKASKDIKLGGIGILTWQDGKIKTNKVGARDTGKGAGWGVALGAVTGILSGGVTLIGGALVGAAAGAMGGALYHKNLGLSDANKQELDKHLQNGGAALVVMVDEDEVEPTKEQLANMDMGVKIDDYKVPDETASKIDAATDVKPVDDTASSTDAKASTDVTGDKS